MEEETEEEWEWIEKSLRRRQYYWWWLSFAQVMMIQAVADDAQRCWTVILLVINQEQKLQEF